MKNNIDLRYHIVTKFTNLRSSIMNATTEIHVDMSGDVVQTSTVWRTILIKKLVMKNDNMVYCIICYFNLLRPRDTLVNWITIRSSLPSWVGIGGLSKVVATQRTHDAMITSSWRRNDVATSFRRLNDVIIASCAHWAPSAMWAGPLIYLWPGTTGYAWIIPSSRIWDYVLHVEQISCAITNWPTSVSQPFSSLNSSLGFAGGKHHQKIIIPIFRLIFQNFAIPGCFPHIIFYCYIFSLLSSGWFVIAVCYSISV